ncbi:MAG TPA: hypothetical protein VFF28_08190 [Candidatus Nanoarchaeia archaeon]|nr:hypothetical protein [Candidatus Nanoarchaeia archaeon]
MRRVILVLVALLLLAAGCKQQVVQTNTKPFIGGTSAVEFNFIEGSPPAEVYDGGSFPFEVTVNLENKGEYDVPKDKMKVYLQGFDPSDFNRPLIVKNPDEPLAKAYIDSEGNTVPGTVTYLTFTNFSYMGTLKANTEYKMRVNLCYIYGGIAQANLCILDDLTKPNDKVCEVNEKKSLATSSSPVQIENFVENIAGTDKVTFSFDVVHRGSGLVSIQNRGCSEETIDKNKVWVEIESGLPGLTCSGLSDGTATTGYTALYGGKRMIRCTQSISDASLQGEDFEKKINMKLVYDYKEHKELNLLVKHTT